MTRLFLNFTTLLTLAMLSWGLTLNPARAENQTPAHVWLKLERTCREAVRNGCPLEQPTPTTYRVMELPASSCEQVRGVAIYTLGEMGDNRAVGLLISLLQDPDRHIRRIAVRALGKIGDPRAADALVVLLSRPEENLSVRRTALWALNRIGRH